MASRQVAATVSPRDWEEVSSLRRELQSIRTDVEGQLLNKLARLEERLEKLEGSSLSRKPTAENPTLPPGYVQVPDQSNPPEGGHEVVSPADLHSRIGRSDGEELPATMFSWCMWSLANEDESKHGHTLRMLALMLLLQHLLMLGFTEAAVFQNVRSHWLGANQHSETTCIYSAADSYFDMAKYLGENPKIYNGQPMPILAIGTAAITLITYSISLQDISVLETLYPGPNKSFLVRMMVFYSWFVQAIFLPGVFSASVAMLLADSRDALEIVMNTLAVTFLLEIDDMMYVAVLNEEQKASYQSCGSLVRANLAAGNYQMCACTWHTKFLKITDFVLMVFIFLYFRFDHVAGPAYIVEMTTMSGTWHDLILIRWFIPYAVRTAVHCLAAWSGHNSMCWQMSQASRVVWTGLCALIGGVGGIAYYVVWKTFVGSSNFNIPRMSECLDSLQ
mmetsp:Transcript_45572/g.83444  ORF Transcript_45572/g.83444 Transcript_45572/m.83444 type:complete len:448 (-) Transcript_45572:193-1536(-)